MIIIKKFYSEQIARLYESRLQDAGIPCFLSNTTTTTLVPFGDGGVSLHVQETDVDRAMKVIRELDSNQDRIPEEDFSNASLEDIEYAREVHEYEVLSRQKPWQSRSFIFLLIFFILVLVLSIILGN